MAKLATEQKQWQAQKISRERELAGLDAKIRARQSIKEELIVAVAELTTDKDSLIGNIETLGSQKKHIEDEITVQIARKNDLTEQNDQLEANIARKRASVDASIAKYKEDAQTAANEALSELTAKVSSTNELLAGIEAQVANKRKELSDVNESILNATETFEQEKV